MAILDSQNNAVVIRVVYDGAPKAGKTTSVYALGKGLGAGVFTPGELNGRTLYFDWLDYTGGLFEGHRIRCQIVSAPGQASLASRRRKLLESADVVVFVGDSTPAAFEADRAYIGSLCSVLREQSGPVIGIVLQANKRDLPNAVPIDQMRTRLDGMEMKVGVVESVATEGLGIREAFVFAVRLALDRVRELMRSGELRTGRPIIDSADDLLRELRQREDGVLNLAAESGLTHTRLSELRPTVATQALEQVVREDAGVAQLSIRTTPAGAEPVQPEPPNERVASGLVWPPIDGRVILQEIGAARFRLDFTGAGDWSGIVNDRWRVHTPAHAVFSTIEQGRSALIQLARIYAGNARTDSVERCVALAEDGHGRFRLWQVQRIAG